MIVTSIFIGSDIGFSLANSCLDASEKLHYSNLKIKKIPISPKIGQYPQLSKGENHIVNQ